MIKHSSLLMLQRYEREVVGNRKVSLRHLTRPSAVPDALMGVIALLKEARNCGMPPTSVAGDFGHPGFATRALS